MSKARIILPVEGMSCASCAATVQEALASADGVVGATVNFATGKAAVDYDDDQTHVAELIKTVRSAGYNCGKASVTFTVEQLHYAASVLPLEQALARVKGVIRAAANQATETVTVDYLPGVTTGEELERAVERAGFGVGTGAAYLYSLVATFAPDVFAAAGLPADVYYEAVCAIIALILLGRLLEARARGRTSAAIRHLAGLRAKAAHVVREGREVEI